MSGKQSEDGIGHYKQYYLRVLAGVDNVNDALKVCPIIFFVIGNLEIGWCYVKFAVNC